MPRKLRYLEDEGHYHVIARANNQLPIFDRPENCKTFKRLLLESKRKYDWKLYHYCLMKNHFHLLLKVAKGNDLPKLMQYLLLGYSRWYRKRNKYGGHLWEGRYKSPHIEKESYLLECGRFIERTPLRAEAVKRLKDHPWSSFHYYAYGKTDSAVDEDPHYQTLGKSPKTKRLNYRKLAHLKGPYDALVENMLLEGFF